MIADFSRPVSIDLLFTVVFNAYLKLHQVDRLARVLVVPGSMHQLEEEEDRKLNESFRDPRSTHILLLVPPVQSE